MLKAKKQIETTTCSNVTTYNLKSNKSSTGGTINLNRVKVSHRFFFYLFRWATASVGFASLFGRAVQCTTFRLAGAFISRELKVHMFIAFVYDKETSVYLPR